MGKRRRAGERYRMTTIALPRRRFLIVGAGLGLSALLGCRPNAPRPGPSHPARAPTPPLTPLPPSPAPTRVRFGVDALLENPAALQHQRVGLITNQTGRSADGRSTIDLLNARTDLNLRALFAPEHGLRGAEAPGEPIATGRDAMTGLPVYSLYGQTLKPTPAMLADLDTLVYDLQDVGARSYTYIWTMALAMQAAADQHLRFVVLDRPDPLGGALVQGNVLDPQFASFVGLYPAPMRYGLTAGELARYLNSEKNIHVDLTVVPLAGWTRTRYYDETGLPWTPPSPNMPDLESAIHYPGLCLFEGTNLSVGRGTARAFQQLGAPWLDNAELVRRLATYSLAGVRFDAVAFRPAHPGDGKFADQLVRGVRFITTDRTTYDPTHAALAALREMQRLHADRLTWNVANFDRHAGSARVREQIQAGAPLAEITLGWEAQLVAFKHQCAPYLLYA
jgi:uncharacterized protein YbbC (DUF1343 family)